VLVRTPVRGRSLRRQLLLRRFGDRFLPWHASSSPGESKHKEVRYLDIHEDDQLDEAQMATCIRQAASLPGWVP
jgi:hypothetical protein